MNTIMVIILLYCSEQSGSPEALQI